MSQLDLMLTDACRRVARSEDKPFDRRVRVVKKNKHCPASHADIWLSRNSHHTFHGPPVVYVNQRIVVEALRNIEREPDHILRLVNRIVSAVYELTHFPTIANAIGRNVEPHNEKI